MNNYQVRRIESKDTYEWLLKKHYAKRKCSISYAFGLFRNNKLEGICTFGFPPNYNFNNGKCVFKEYQCLTLELNRLCINSNNHKNALSYFVSNCLKLLPTPSCIVSYADQNNGHNGYIYQATNWIYTGLSTKKYKYIFEDGSEFDIRRGINKKGKIIDKIELLPTHRYLYFNGNKTEIKNMKNNLKMKIFKYPKGENRRYECIDIKTNNIQNTLF
jgi:hypothetical protein